MRTTLRLAAVFMLLLATAPTVWADAITTATDLRTAGIDVDSYQPITFTWDGRTLVGFDRAPFEEKKHGVMYRLWLLDFDVSGRLEEARKVPLAIPSFEQGSLNADEDAFVIISDAGTRYLTVDMETLEVADLMKPEAGKPGFRADPPVLWTADGKLLTTGYFYDENRYADNNTIATVNTSATGQAAFTEGPDIQQVERSHSQTRGLNYNSDKLGYFLSSQGDDMLLSRWTPDGGFSQVDRAEQFTGLWGAATRVLYSAARAGGQHDLIVYDGAQDRKWNLATGAEPYRYLFLSKDGTTAVACQFEPVAQRMNVFVGKERGDFGLTPVDGLQRIKIGWIRVSPEGRYLAVYNERGLSIAELP